MPGTMNVRRSILVVVLLAAVGVVLAVSAWRLELSPATADGSPPGRLPGHAGDATDRRTERALRILHGWDQARAAAYAAGDVSALRRLYVAGSVAGARDVGWLREYVDAGLVVEDLQTQLLSAGVTRWAPGHLDLVVTDRLSTAVAVDGGGGRYPLPRDLATTFTVSLVHGWSGWVVSEAAG